MLYHLRCTYSGDHPPLPVIDAMLRDLVCQILNVNLNDLQWDQASLPVKWGGPGIRKTTHVASSAFLASAAGVVDLVSTMRAKDTALSAWNQVSGGTATADQEARAQKCWDTQIIKSVAESLMRAATDDYTKLVFLQHQHHTPEIGS